VNLRRLGAMFRKEAHHIVRDPRSLGMALAVPLLLLLLFGYALSLDVDRIPTLIYDLNRTAMSRQLISQFEGSRYFDIRGFVDNDKAIEQGIDKGQILMGIAIPVDFSDKLGSGQEVSVQILLDGSDSNTAAIAKGYAESVLRGYSHNVRAEAQNRRGGMRLVSPIDPRIRVWYNSSLESRNYIVPGLIAVILMIIAALLTSMTIAREWEMGTMEQLMSTPLRPAEIVLGKMLAFFVIGVVDIIVCVVVGVFVFHVPLRGSIVLLGVTSCVFLCGALFWGILISVIAKSQLLAFQMGILSSFLPAMMLSGFIYAIDTMPLPIQAITYIVPARYFVTIVKGIYLKGVGLSVLWAEVLFLVVYSVVVFLIAVRKLRAKLA
jgi:ABC-2 type transport system permease protein